jgi:hypothetical protein
LKIYGPPEGAPGRYSPGQYVEAEKRRVEGRPDPAHISISDAERQNLSRRMGTRGSTRLANAFSNAAENHAVATCFMHCDLVRIHRPLRCGPAMAADVTARLWELADMVKVLQDWAARQGMPWSAIMSAAAELGFRVDGR